MIEINTPLLEQIESELLEHHDGFYQKIISISEYNIETKRTLDLLVEKYGGFVNRYQEKVVLIINYSSTKYKASTTLSKNENKTQVFEEINSILDRLTTIEQKIDKIIEDQQRIMKDTNKSVFSYLNYFKSNEDKKNVHHLVDEIMNHR